MPLAAVTCTGCGEAIPYPESLAGQSVYYRKKFCTVACYLAYRKRPRVKNPRL